MTKLFYYVYPYTLSSKHLFALFYFKDNSVFLIFSLGDLFSRPHGRSTEIKVNQLAKTSCVDSARLDSTELQNCFALSVT